jgi:predicted metal-dependent hydrolase
MSLPLREQLFIDSVKVAVALTAAYKHHTAVFAYATLAYPALLDRATPEMQKPGCWHAMEEAEHKAVAIAQHLVECSPLPFRPIFPRRRLGLAYRLAHAGLFKG